MGIGPDYAQRAVQALVLPGGVSRLRARARSDSEGSLPGSPPVPSPVRRTLKMVDTYVAPLADSLSTRRHILEKSTSYILNQRRSDAALQLRDAEQRWWKISKS